MTEARDMKKGRILRPFPRFGGTESRKNAHSIISVKQNGILLPSRFAAFRLSAIRQTISRKPGLIPCRWLAPHKRLSLRLYRYALTAVCLFLIWRQIGIYVFAFVIEIDNAYSMRDIF